MRIVFLLVGYYPKFTAVGNCVSKLAERMSEGNEIIVITNKNIDKQSSIEVWKNQMIRRISTQRMSKQLYLSRIIEESKGVRKAFYKSKLIFHKLFWNSIQLSNKYGLDLNLIDAYYKELKSVDGKIDAVIPCCMPWEAVYASAKFTIDNNIPLFPLLFDPYSENIIFFRNKIIKKLKYKNAFTLEKNVFEHSNHIFFTDNWDEYFEKNKEYNFKSTRIEHPLIKKIDYPAIPLKNKKKINLVYQGELNFEMRLPNKTLNFFKLMKMKFNDFKLHFFTFGNATSIVEKFSKEHPDIMEYYGQIEKNIADMYLMDEDISIIIGNNSPNVVPSKVFECISLGRPIIYFYKSVQDKSIKILKKYPLVKFIKQGDYSSKIISDAIDWIKSVYRERILFDKIKLLYNEATPDFVYNKINNAISVIGSKSSE